jgi:hypothetical protein
MSITQILENFVSVKIETLSHLVSPQIPLGELEAIVARLVSDNQLRGFRIDGEYIVRDNPDIDPGDVAIRMLNNVVSSSVS